MIINIDKQMEATEVKVNCSSSVAGVTGNATKLIVAKLRKAAVELMIKRNSGLSNCFFKY